MNNKNKWSILVEYDAKNIKEFEDAFYDDDFMNISREWVKGIVMVDNDAQNIEGNNPCPQCFVLTSMLNKLLMQEKMIGINETNA